MRLTVLGSSASYAGPSQACAGYLIESGSTRVVFDLGNGTLANLGVVANPLSVGAVFISHGHPDHFADLYALQSLLRYAPQGPAPAMRLFAPESLLGRIACLLSEHGRREFAEAFKVGALADRIPVRVDGIVVTPFLVDHEEATFALVAEAEERRLCYTADTRPGVPVQLAAKGCDLLLAEATLPEGYSGIAPHMTASEAAALASTVSAKTLVLTHLWPTTPRDEILKDAEKGFGGTVHVADELFAVDV